MSENLKRYLERRNISYKLHSFKGSTATVEKAAEQLNIDREKIIKTLVFIDEARNPVLAIVTGDRRVSKEKLRKILGAKKMKIADSKTVEEVTGFEVGALPPIGHRREIETYIDAEVMRFEKVYGGGGSKNSLVEISPEDIKHTRRAEIADISE